MADDFKYSSPDGRTLSFPSEPSPEQLDAAFQHDLMSRIDQHADEQGVPREIAHGLVATESSYRHTDNDGNPVKPKPTPDNPRPTARGLTQMTDAALRDVGEDGKSVDSNLRAGMKYLKSHYNGDWAKALAAYKQGAGSIAKDGIKPETRDYQARVLMHDGAQMTGGPVDLGGSPQSISRDQRLQTIQNQFPDAPWKVATRMGAHTLAPAVGAAALTPELGPLGTGAGMAGGYATADALLTALGIQDPAKFNPKELAKTSAELGVTGVAGPYGPAAFGAAGGIIEAVKLELARRQGQGPGASDKLATSDYGGLAGMTGLDRMPYSKVLARASTDALMDLAARFGITKLTGGAGHMTGEIRNAQRGLESTTAEVGEQQSRQAALDAQRTQVAKAQAARETVAAHAPEVAAAKQAELLGMTPEQARAQFVTDPADGGIATEQATQQRQAMANAVHKPIQRIQDQLGEEYEQLLAPHMDAEASTTGLHSDIAQHIGELKEKNLWRQLAPGTKRLYGQALRLAQAQEARAAIADAPKPNLMYAGVNEARAAEAAMVPPKPTNVGDLLRLRSDASKNFAFGNSALDREQSMLLQDYTMKALEDSGVATKELKALNARYKYDRDAFRGVAGKVATNVDPADYGSRVFGDRVAAHKIWDAATPAEREDLRGALGTYVFSRNNPRTALNTLAKDGVLERYFGNSALSKARVWIETAPKAVKLDTLLAESPQAKATYDAALKQRLDGIASKSGDAAIKQVRALADRLGPVGDEFIDKLNATSSKDPKAAMQMAQQFLDSVNPRKAGAMPPTKILAMSLARIPQGAWQAAHSTHMQAMALRGMLEQAEHGRVASHVQAWGALYALKLPGQAIKAGLYTALRNPRLAEAYIKAINSGNLETVAHASADAIAAQASSAINDDSAHMRNQETQ